MTASKKLQDIGREITARVAALDKHGEKSVNLIDSINSLLDQARTLCESPEDFAAFKQTYCPKLGQSRTYELLAIREGRKTLEEIRETGRLRVAKHRATKRDVTERDSVTSETRTDGKVRKKPAAAAGNGVDPADTAEQRKATVAEPDVDPPKADTVTGDDPEDNDDTGITPEKYVALLSDYWKLVDRNSVLTAALNTKEIEAGWTWPPDMNKKQQKKRDRYLESISYFQLELERLYAEVTKQPSWRAEITTKSGERLFNGARFATRGEVDAYALQLSKEEQGKIEVEVIPCESDKPNVQFQGTKVHFAHGDCVLLNWRPAS
jgi:hypothetical protein